MTLQLLRGARIARHDAPVDILIWADGRIERIAPRIEAGPGGVDGVRVTGPAPAPFERLRGEWRFQLLVRATSGAAVRRAVASLSADISFSRTTRAPPRDSSVRAFQS